MPDLRRWFRSVDPPGKEDINARTAFRFGSTVLFFALLIAFVALSVSADMVAIAILASVIVSQMLWVLLPVDDIRDKARMLATGEAGDEVFEELDERRG